MDVPTEHPFLIFQKGSEPERAKRYWVPFWSEPSARTADLQSKDANSLHLLHDMDVPTEHPFLIFYFIKSLKPLEYVLFPSRSTHIPYMFSEDSTNFIPVSKSILKTAVARPSPCPQSSVIKVTDI